MEGAESLRETGVRTRSMAKQLNAPFSLLAPAKLSPQNEQHRPVASHNAQVTGDGDVSSFIVNDSVPNVVSHDRCLVAQKSAKSNSYVESVALNSPTPVDVPMDCSEVPPSSHSSDHSLPAFRPIDISSAVCCSFCHVIYQCVAGRPFACPLCSARKVHKLQYSEDLKSLRDALDSCTAEIKKLHQSVEGVKGSVAELNSCTCSNKFGCSGASLTV